MGFLFLAGALLCTGDTAAAETAYQRALEFDWPPTVRQPVHSQVCNVWDAGTRMVDAGAGPCALEELPVDDAAEDERAHDGPSSQTEGEESTDSEDADPPSDADDPNETDDPTETDDASDTGDPADTASDDDGGP